MSATQAQSKTASNLSSQIDFKQKYLFLDEAEMSEYLRIQTF